jgi:hypothetical protein
MNDGNVGWFAGLSIALVILSVPMLSNKKFIIRIAGIIPALAAVYYANGSISYLIMRQFGG